MYLTALAVGLAGAVIARLRAHGMSLALGGAAITTLLVGVVAIGVGWSDRPGASAIEILGLSGMYAALFAAAALLFRSAAAPAAAVV